MTGSFSRHRRRDELLKPRAAGELGEPAFEMPQLRFADAFDAEPAPCIGAERDIGDREIVAFDEASRRHPSGSQPCRAFRPAFAPAPRTPDDRPAARSKASSPASGRRWRALSLL